MLNQRLWLSIGTTAVVLLSGATVRATSVEMGVFKSVDAPDARCPVRVVLTENSQPYEGGYKVTGQAKLGWLTGPFAIAATDPFSVTWVAPLKAEYRQCQATGRIVKYDGEASDSHPYLRLRFTGGKLFLILDMTGMSDANGFTPVITNKDVLTGAAVWTWAGSD